MSNMARAHILLPLSLALSLLFVQTAGQLVALTDDRCCFSGQPTDPQAQGHCDQDAYCAGPDQFECSAASNCGATPQDVCQNCGCCPCCDAGHVCCPPDNIGSTPRFDKLRRTLSGDASSYYNKGQCRPYCENNCNGHGECKSNKPGQCPDKSCECVTGFDPAVSCSTCLPSNFGVNCTQCPAVVNGSACSGHGTCNGAGTTSGDGKCKCDSGFDVAHECGTCIDTAWGKDCASCPGVSDGRVCHGHGTCDGAGTLGGSGQCTCVHGWDVQVQCATCEFNRFSANCTLCPGVGDSGTPCSGHGSCDGAGTDGGTGKCTCSYGWRGEGCEEFYCPKGCDSDHGTCVAADSCSCNHGWTGADCANPKCPTSQAPTEPGCVHGNCTISPTPSHHCDCDSGWGGKRCDAAICPQGCVPGQGLCTSPGNCKCVAGYSGDDCGQAVCNPPCSPLGGSCTAPDHCSCKPLFQGISCEVQNAPCCYQEKGCGDSPTGCRPCCRYPPGERITLPDGSVIVGCAGQTYSCRNCDCQECCKGGGYCSPASAAAPGLLGGGTGKCCDGHRQGMGCHECQPLFFGLNCTACPGIDPGSQDSTPCSGHGRCFDGVRGNGTCSCQTGYTGDACEVCDPTFCPSQCSGHGTCICSGSKRSTGIPTTTCDCSAGWDGDKACSSCSIGVSGDDCGECAPGYFGKGVSPIKCLPCACDTSVCDDGRNGTGACPSVSPSAGHQIPASKLTPIIVGACGGAVALAAAIFAYARCGRSSSPAMREQPSVRAPLLQSGHQFSALPSLGEKEDADGAFAPLPGGGDVGAGVNDDLENMETLDFDFPAVPDGSNVKTT